MDAHGTITLPPSPLDSALADCCERNATPRTQQKIRLITLLADEKAVLAFAGAVWAMSRVARGGPDRRSADRLIWNALIAGAVPHATKALVDRKRPDRSVREPRNGIGKSGKPWDSFPSGHAVHLGAIAGPLAELAPPTLRPLVWPAILSLASTRVFILAQYATDVFAGLGLGCAIDYAVGRLRGRS
jgi:membrane-associated phospholipid phosphatase